MELSAKRALTSKIKVKYVKFLFHIGSDELNVHVTRNRNKTLN